MTLKQAGTELYGKAEIQAMMNILEEAIIYATVMHQGKVRKFKSIPYILHPLEVAQILSTMTDDQEVITAGILHDIIQDTDGTLSEIEKRFGKRVALLVSSETEDVAKTVNLLVGIDRELGYPQGADKPKENAVISSPEDWHKQIVRLTRLLGIHLARMISPWKGYNCEAEDVAKAIELLDDIDQEMGYPSDPRNP